MARPRKTTAGCKILGRNSYTSRKFLCLVGVKLRQGVFTCVGWQVTLCDRGLG